MSTADTHLHRTPIRSRPVRDDDWSDPKNPSRSWSEAFENARFHFITRELNAHRWRVRARALVKLAIFYFALWFSIMLLAILVQSVRANFEQVRRIGRTALVAWVLKKVRYAFVLAVNGIDDVLGGNTCC